MKTLCAFVLYCFVVVTGVCAMTPQRCFLFGDTAHNNPANLYVASLDVGTGECHVVRQGDHGIIVDAGMRRGPLIQANTVKGVAGMLGHNLRPDPNNPNDQIFDNATLHAFFTTHPHDDHTGMISEIIDDNNILKNLGLSVFLGGLGNEYEQALVNDIVTFNPAALLGNGVHNIGGFNISAFDVDGNFQNAQAPQDINRFGSVIGVNFAGRNIAFLGDIDNDGFKGITQTIIGNHVVGQPLGAPAVHPMHNFLQQADVVTVSHHGLLSNYEGYIYRSLLRSSPNRVFLVSGNPNDHFAILSEILIDLDQATKVQFHDVSLLNVFYDPAQQNFNGIVATHATNTPLFPTHDAPHGFVWTRIEPNGNISIHDGNVFQRVL